MKLLKQMRSTRQRDTKDSLQDKEGFINRVALPVIEGKSKGLGVGLPRKIPQYLKVSPSIRDKPLSK